MPIKEYFYIFLSGILKGGEKEVRELPPKTRALQGLLKNTDVDVEDYRAYLLKKHR